MIEENVEVQPKGAQWVLTPKGRPLDVRSFGGNSIMTSTGRVQMKRYWTDTVLATGRSDETIIAAPAAATHQLVVFAYTVMCDAATTVTFRSNSSTTIGMPLYCAASGGITREPTGVPLLVCVPGQPLAITTSGGNTSLDIHFIEIEIGADIL